MKLYLAGPMRGVPYFNFPAFTKAAIQLRTQGHTVFNPAEQDDVTYGRDISEGNFWGCVDHAELEYGFNLREALGRDTAWICAHAEGVALLPGWEGSKGTRAEKALAEALGLKVFYL